MAKTPARQYDVPLHRAVGPATAHIGPAQVARVVDGDTLIVLEGGNRVTVQLTGVDTPETVHPTRGVEPYGPEAAAYTAPDSQARPSGL